MWNDTTLEPREHHRPRRRTSRTGTTPARTSRPATAPTTARCYPNPAPMIINTARLEGDNPIAAGPDLGPGARLQQPARPGNQQRDTRRIDFVIYRLEVDNITNAILAKFQRRRAGAHHRRPGAVHQHHLAGVLADAREHRQAVGGRRADPAEHPPGRHAHEDAGDVDVRDQRLVELRSELAARPRLLRVGGHQAGDLSGDRRSRRRDVERHGRIRSAAAHAAERGESGRARRQASTGVATTTSLVWNIAAWAVSYDVYLGTSQSNMTLVGNVPAQLVINPPNTYSWTPPSPLQPRHDVLLEGRLAHQRDAAGADDDRDLVHLVVHDRGHRRSAAGAVVARRRPTARPASARRRCSAGPPAPPGRRINVAFGTTNPPPAVASGLDDVVVHAGHAGGEHDLLLEGHRGVERRQHGRADLVVHDRGSRAVACRRRG